MHYAGPYRRMLSSSSLRIAIIGSRSASENSLHGLRTLAAKLTEFGSIIVSGAAKGTDMMAHQGALDSGGPTIACVPFGLEQLEMESWRPEFLHRDAPDLLLLLSIFDPRQETNRQTPVLRNRLIAALAEVVVIGEAESGSGTFHCVAKAQKLGVPMFFLKYQNPQSSEGDDLARLHRNLERMRMSPFYLDECESRELCRRIYDQGLAYRRENYRTERAQPDLFDLDEV